MTRRNNSTAHSDRILTPAQTVAAECRVAEKKVNMLRREEEREAKKAASRVIWRLALRSPHEEALAHLPTLTCAVRIEPMLAERWNGECRAVYEQHLNAEPPALAASLRTWHRDAWVYNAHPISWQTELFLKFIKYAPEGSVFTQQEASRWLKQTYGLDAVVEQLFFAQYSARSFAQFSGNWQSAISAWYFTPLENDMIPNIYLPVDSLLHRLAGARAIQQIEGGPGRFEVLKQMSDV